MKKIAVALLLGLVTGLGVLGDASAGMITIEATVTADNHYAIYYGRDWNLTYLNATNESGSAGNPGTYNWSEAENWTFNVEEDNYLYVVAWSDDSVAQAWKGKFVLNTGETIYSDSSWQYILTQTDLDDGAIPPSADQVEQNIIAHQPWKTGVTLDGYIWSPISGLDSPSHWIWGSAQSGGSDNGEYQIFRIAVGNPVPEPGTLLLLGVGLTGLATLRRRTGR